MINKSLLSTTAIALCIGFVALYPVSAVAQQYTSELIYYNLTEKELKDNFQEWRTFLEYNSYREPCQNYQAPPEGFVVRNCNVYRKDVFVPAEAPQEEILTLEETSQEKTSGTKISTVHFGFDKSEITPEARKTIGQLADRIKESKVDEVYVSGFASTIGDTNYNQLLSERRAQAVTDELIDSGVDSEKIVQTAYGEAHLAVQTENGVKMPANRRAIISFGN